MKQILFLTFLFLCIKIEGMDKDQMINQTLSGHTPLKIIDAQSQEMLLAKSFVTKTFPGLQRDNDSVYTLPKDITLATFKYLATYCERNNDNEFLHKLFLEETGQMIYAANKLGYLPTSLTSLKEFAYNNLDWFLSSPKCIKKFLEHKTYLAVEGLHLCLGQPVIEKASTICKPFFQEMLYPKPENQRTIECENEERLVVPRAFIDMFGEEGALKQYLSELGDSGQNDGIIRLPSVSANILKTIITHLPRILYYNQFGKYKLHKEIDLNVTTANQLAEIADKLMIPGHEDFLCEIGKSLYFKLWDQQMDGYVQEGQHGFASLHPRLKEKLILLLKRSCHLHGIDYHKPLNTIEEYMIAQHVFSFLKESLKHSSLLPDYRGFYKFIETKLIQPLLNSNNLPNHLDYPTMRTLLYINHYYSFLREYLIHQNFFELCFDNEHYFLEQCRAIICYNQTKSFEDTYLKIEKIFFKDLKNAVLFYYLDNRKEDITLKPHIALIYDSWPKNVRDYLQGNIYRATRPKLERNPLFRFSEDKSKIICDKRSESYKLVDLVDIVLSNEFLEIINSRSMPDIFDSSLREKILEPLITKLKPILQSEMCEGSDYYSDLETALFLKYCYNRLSQRKPIELHAHTQTLYYDKLSQHTKNYISAKAVGIEPCIPN